MSHHHKERLEDLILQETNTLFLRETEFPRGAITTLMRVELNEDLTHATLWVSIFPLKYVDSVMKQLKTITPFIGHQLVKRLHMRFVPAIQFEHDTSNEQLSEVDQLLKSVSDGATKGNEA